MATVQQQAVKMTQAALDGLFRTARHIPDDKYAWIPQGEARTAQSQINECALSPLFFLTLLQGKTVDLSDEAVQRRRQQLEESLTTLDAAEAFAQEHYPKLFALMEAIPDAQLDEPRTLPFRGGMTVTTTDMLFLPLQNIIYHTGQINYLQTMLGDTEMH